jgi:hypothetical protein
VKRPNETNEPIVATPPAPVGDADAQAHEPVPVAAKQPEPEHPILLEEEEDPEPSKRKKQKAFGISDACWALYGGENGWLAGDSDPEIRRTLYGTLCKCCSFVAKITCSLQCTKDTFAKHAASLAHQVMYSTPIMFPYSA